MKSIRLAATGAFVLTVVILATAAMATAEVIGAHLDGFDEVPALSSPGSGLFFGNIRPDGSAIDYILYYEIEGAAVTVAHIHVGQRGVSGGIAAFLCGGGGKPACPSPSGSVSGTVEAADINGPSAQGVATGELAEVIRAIRKGAAYVNVHSSGFPSGEIRGQLR